MAEPGWTNRKNSKNSIRKKNASAAAPAGRYGQFVSGRCTVLERPVATVAPQRIRRLQAVVIRLVLLLNCGLFSTQLSAQQQDPNERGKLFDLSLKELMEIEVVSASRQQQSAAELTVPVSIITAEDIRAGGLTSIPEIIQFAPGVDVLKIGRNRYAVGIRGLHETFSDRTTLLVNGRQADNPVYGGPDFQGLPVMIDDIERIEILRSPGSASWGANALTGMINIVTKKPRSVLGGFARTSVTHLGDSYTHLRYADAKDKWSWRFSAGYENLKSSDDAVNGNASYKLFTPSLHSLIGFSNYEAHDFTRDRRFDAEAICDISQATQLSLGLAHTHVESGDFELGGFYPMENIREDHIRSFAKINHKRNNGDDYYLQWFSKFWNANWPMAALFSAQQNEFEGQYNFAAKNRHRTSIGASFRWDHINSSAPNAQQVRFGGDPIDEYNVGLFAIDRWRKTDRLTIESQIRGDWYSGTQADWSGRLTALYALDPQNNHTLRLSAAKAFRAPLVELRKASSTIIPMGGDLYVINVDPPGHLDNEETFALEAGYTGKLTQSLTLRTDAYYQKFNKLIGYRSRTNLFGQSFATADNINGADAWGNEVELILTKGKAKLSAWYAYNNFEYNRPNQDFGAFLPAKHKAGLSARMMLDRGWDFNTNYKFTDTTRGNPFTGNNDVGSSNRLDLTLTKHIAGDRGRVILGVSDVLKAKHEPIRESIRYAGHKTPGRTFFVSLMFRF